MWPCLQAAHHGQSPLSVIIAPQIFVMGHPRKIVGVFQRLLKARCD